MLNLDETLNINSSYWVQRDLYIRGFYYSFSLVLLVEILRSQVPEIDLLQLIPGFYLILLFSSYFILISFSDSLSRFPLELDNAKIFGTKTITRIRNNFVIKLSYYLLLSVFFVAISTIVPISFESFNAYGEKTLENVWSFDELINIEIILIMILIILSQLPILSFSVYTTEKFAKRASRYWKKVIFFLILFAAIVTPTIDASTQLTVCASGLYLYFIQLSFIIKRQVSKDYQNIGLTF
jgi:hypothetical protein